MSKVLPKSVKNPQGFTTFMKTERGFTLVELLVVVSIIAILSVIGVVVFANVQKGARDARRKADIQAISKVMETNYNDSTGQYPLITAAMFAGGAVPQDPLTGSNNCQTRPCKYCSRAPGNCEAVSGTVTAGVEPGGGSTYSVCANLESGTGTSSYYCLSSQRSL